MGFYQDSIKSKTILGFLENISAFAKSGEGRVVVLIESELQFHNKLPISFLVMRFPGSVQYHIFMGNVLQNPEPHPIWSRLRPLSG